MDKYMMCCIYTTDDIILKGIIGYYKEDKDIFILAYEVLESDCLDKDYLREHLIEKYTFTIFLVLQSKRKTILTLYNYVGTMC
jgi:hypothetical protein